MFLYMNVYITDARLTAVRRGHLAQDPRDQVFKYMLASLACIDRISGGVVRVEFDEPYAGKFQEIANFGREVFGDRVRFVEQRATSARQWRDNLESDLKDVPDEESVVFFCNDDHIFLDSNLDMLYRCVDAMETDPEEYKAVVLSHWPEHLKVARAPFCSELQEHEHFVTFKWASDDSYQVVNARLLRRWFFSLPVDHKGWLPRSDGMFWGLQHYKAWLPKKELVRHFDGYGAQNMCIGEAPPLEIPKGFFSGDVRIDIGGAERRNGWTLFNPDMPVRTTHPEGCDYKWVEEDIPLFWRERVAEIERNRPRMYGGRNDAIRTLALAEHHTNWTRGNPHQPEASWYEYSFIEQGWCMVYYVFDTLTEKHLRLNMESLVRQPEFLWDTFVLYNASTQFTDEFVMDLARETGLLDRFKYVEKAPSIAQDKSVSADFVHQFRTIHSHRFYFLCKPDFYLAEGSIAAMVNLLEARKGQPAILNFKKYDIRESATDDQVRELAALGDFGACLGVENVKMWHDEPVGLEHWALGFWGPDGVTHAYTDESRWLPQIQDEESKATWGYCSVLESAEKKGAELFYDDKVYAMHIYHEVPTKHGPPHRMQKGYRY